MIVFDLDDTLYKERDFVESGIQAVAADAAEVGFISQNEAYKLIKNAPEISSGFDKLAALALKADYAEIFDIQRILAVYRHHKPNISLPADSLEILEKCKRDGITTGLITDGRSVTQRAKIEALGLSDYILADNILISQEIGSDKRWATPFEMMMKRNMNENTFIYVGDNPEKDFYWPNRLGWETIMLLDTDNSNIHSQSPEIIRDSDYYARHTITELAQLTRNIRQA